MRDEVEEVTPRVLPALEGTQATVREIHALIVVQIVHHPDLVYADVVGTERAAAERLSRRGGVVADDLADDRVPVLHHQLLHTLE